jgi:type III pantothenate kinase
MGQKITIDQGNTAAKVAVWDGDTIVAETSYRHLTPDDISALAERFAPIDAAIYSTVIKRDDDVVNALHACSPKVIELTHMTPMPIELGYATPASLGRDRIAAAVGAYDYATAKNCWTMVVDMGTAITYDVITPAGRFIGGNIAPGIFMRLEALHSFTAALPAIETDGDCPEWGYDTPTAMRAGAIRGVVAELEHYRRTLPASAQVVLTGGSADLVADKLSFPIIIDHDLVSKGLISIIKYNESN